nr:hypothetical protein [Tanacetum cinerariifolium]
NVVLHVVTDDLAEGVQQDLADDERDHSQDDVQQWPSLFQCSKHHNDLANNVDCQEDRAEKVDHDEESDGVLRPQSGPSLECQNRHRERYQKHDGAASVDQPDRKCRAVLVHGESNASANH